MPRGLRANIDDALALHYTREDAPPVVQGSKIRQVRGIGGSKSRNRASQARLSACRAHEDAVATRVLRGPRCRVNVWSPYGRASVPTQARWRHPETRCASPARSVVHSWPVCPPGQRQARGSGMVMRVNSARGSKPLDWSSSWPFQCCTTSPEP